MYIPTHFAATDNDAIDRLIQEHSFATLISTKDGVPVASHLPFLWDRAAGEMGALQTHLAKANPQWEEFENAIEVLVIFEGPHAYISPRWYESKPNVPTWNYAAVHIYGVPRIMAEAEFDSFFLKLIPTYEGENDESWRYDSLSEAYSRGLQRAIIGVEISVTRVEAKFKMSQNKTAADRSGVIEGLLATQNKLNEEVARMIQNQESLPDKNET